VDAWRRRLADVRVRATECYVKASLGIGGSELPSAERAARELVDVAPFRESGHLLLMPALAASDNLAEALAAYERLRVSLRDVNSGSIPVRLCRTSTSGFSVSCSRQDFGRASSRPANNHGSQPQSGTSSIMLRMSSAVSVSTRAG
jgi:hypothetical protein